MPCVMGRRRQGGETWSASRLVRTIYSLTDLAVEAEQAGEDHGKRGAGTGLAMKGADDRREVPMREPVLPEPA